MGYIPVDDSHLHTTPQAPLNHSGVCLCDLVFGQHQGVTQLQQDFARLWGPIPSAAIFPVNRLHYMYCEHLSCDHMYCEHKSCELMFCEHVFWTFHLWAFVLDRICSFQTSPMLKHVRIERGKGDKKREAVVNALLDSVLIFSSW